MEQQAREKSAQALSEDILALSRNTLLVNLRFLDRALSLLAFHRGEGWKFAADGENLYYDPWHILMKYRAEQSVICRDLLHVLLHCIFRHSFVGKEIDRLRWDIACDAAVENVICQMNKPVLYAQRQESQAALLQQLRQAVGTMTAERIYHWLGEQQLSEDELVRMRRDFVADQHNLWYGEEEEDAGNEHDVQLLEQLWQEVSRRMQTELETMLHQVDSALVQNLQQLNRPKHDYTAFLRRFGVQGEVVRLSEDEFDQNYYTYGMSLYGNVPLIEPLEYREQKRIRDFVIAIDTSGSVRGEVVQSFIQHTYDILSRQENFFTRMNLHIIQCDDRIQEDAVITCHREFQDYMKTMQIKGLGQTDFRPVFAHVDELLRRRQLTDLRGLLYFTDGRGIFPGKRPAYDTAFIIHAEEYAKVQVPSWAMHLELTEDEILDSKFSNA